jgi:hypothetical protein
MAAKKPSPVEQILDQIDARFILEGIGISLPRNPHSGEFTERDAHADGINTGSFIVIETLEAAESGTFEETKADIAHALRQLSDELKMAAIAAENALPVLNTGSVIEGSKSAEATNYVFNHSLNSYDVVVFNADASGLYTPHGALLNADLPDNTDPVLETSLIVQHLHNLGYDAEVNIYTRTHVCDNCGWKGPKRELQSIFPSIPNITERIEPGGIVPSGTCPKCACLCYPERIET